MFLTLKFGVRSEKGKGPHRGANVGPDGEILVVLENLKHIQVVHDGRFSYVRKQQVG